MDNHFNSLHDNDENYQDDFKESNQNRENSGQNEIFNEDDSLEGDGKFKFIFLKFYFYKENKIGK